ncbi:MAG: flagellar basal body P-ring formation chaperone FlgA [Bacillota bacterium]
MRTRWLAEMRKIVLGLVVFALLSQWGLIAGASGEDLPTPSAEKFMATPAVFRSATVELKAEAIVTGSEIRLEQIARWSTLDAAAMQQSADLVVARFAKGRNNQTIDIEDLKKVLEDAGVNLSAITFCGALACKVTRSDSPVEKQLDLPPVLANPVLPSTRPVIASLLLPPVASSDPAPAATELRTLRDMLVTDLVERLAVPAESLQIHFGEKDEKLANLSEPYFRFDIEPQRLRKLGDVTWNVTITSATGRQKAQVTANVRLWRNELVMTRPVAFRQIIRAEDLTERRVLLDRLNDEMPLAQEQVIGQQAARDLSPGMVLVGRMIQAIEVARINQLITVTVELGRVQVTWIGEARESGTLGQTIRVRKPGTREEFSVMLTGPQQAKLIGSASDGSRPGFAAVP